MPLDIKVAMQYVRAHTFSGRVYRDYAVSDFLLYRDWIKPPITTMKEYQKTWALYLKWTALCGANPSQWSSANGTAFNASEQSRKFRFKPGTQIDEPPTLHPYAIPSTSGTTEATLKGVGQCEYFAMNAFQALKAGGKTGEVPRVDKVATPGHNWVLVNYSPAAPKNTSTWIAVDFWLLALGVPSTKCVCEWKNASLKFGPDDLEIVETFNPDSVA